MEPSARLTKAHEVKSLGETPAEARKRMASEGGAEVEQPKLGMEVKGPLSPAQIAQIRAEEEGFSGTGVDGSVEDAPELAEPPSPSKAMETIRQLSQDKIQLQTELDAALQRINRYRNEFGDLD